MNEIRDIVEAMRACSRFHAENKKPGPGAPGRGAYLLRLHEIQQADADAHERALDVFAALNGWKITKRAFSPQRIGERTADFGCLSRPLFDHCKYFKAGGRNVAILTQPYGGVDFHEERRALNKIGLTLQRPPDPLASFRLSRLDYVPGAHRHRGAAGALVTRTVWRACRRMADQHRRLVDFAGDPLTPHWDAPFRSQPNTAISEGIVSKKIKIDAAGARLGRQGTKAWNKIKSTHVETYEVWMSLAESFAVRPKLGDG